jgi:hypothetical protein
MPELTEDQRKVLDALMVEGATVADRTEAGLQARTGLPDVRPVLGELERLTPPLVELVGVDETLGTQFWGVTLDAAEWLDEA